MARILKQYFHKFYHIFMGLAHQEDKMKDRTQDNVISLFGSPSSEVGLNVPKNIDEQPNANYFEEAMKKNEENAKRMRDSRLKANRSVLRSYRIKK